MFRPTDRASIYDALRPPPGSSIDLLVACTYSASLDTVLSLPAAMVAGVGLSSAKTTFGAAELAALRRVCNRTAIFCQAGAIHPAEMVPPAVVEVEPMVHEVIAPMRKELAMCGAATIEYAIIWQRGAGDTATCPPAVEHARQPNVLRPASAGGPS